MRFHVALDKSKQDFERDLLMLPEISVRSDSGRALGLELNVEQLRTLPTLDVLVAFAKGLQCPLKRRRVAGWELEGLVGHVTFLVLFRWEALSLFQCVHRFARNLYRRRDPLWISARAESRSCVRLGQAVAPWAFSPVMPLSPVAEWHRASEIPQTSRRWVEFLK